MFIEKLKQLLGFFFYLIIFLSIPAAVFFYSYKQCGWGAFAYEYPFIAALTKECAKQQRLQNTGSQP